VCTQEAQETPRKYVLFAVSSGKSGTMDNQTTAVDLDFRGKILLPTNTAELHLSWTGLATRCTGIAVQSEVPIFEGGNSQHWQFILDFHPALT